MERNQYLSIRLREVFLNGTWIANTNYQDQLKQTSWEEANFKIGNLNTIGNLTFHINYYLEGLLSAFKTGQLTIRDQFSYIDTPVTSAEDWDQRITQFMNNAEDFATAVAQFNDAVFDEDFIDTKYGSFLRNIEGVIEHSYYHLGQIVLLKKLIASTTK